MIHPQIVEGGPQGSRDPTGRRHLPLLRLNARRTRYE